MRFVLIGAAIVALDQLTKALVGRTVPPGGARPVIPGLLSLRPAENFGAAFGFFPRWTLLFIAIAVVAVSLMAYWYRRLTWQRQAAKAGLALAAAGAVGNLIDRVRFGYVRDFIDVRWYPAIFNVADVAIVVGIGLLLIALWREEAR
ncbi:MAG: signal peptidase II [Bacillota bacterium]|nr:signal peptidase II [Bacillota bacterium]